MNKQSSGKSLSLAACVVAVLCVTSMPVQAESVDLTVTGTITPAACNPGLTGGGIIDYGVINPGTLSPTALTVLPIKTLTFSIACTAQVKVAITAINGRVNTAAGVVTPGTNSDGLTPVTLFGGTTTGVAGLGLDSVNSAKIGGYAVRIDPGSVIADSNSVLSLRKTVADITWINDAESGDLYDPATTRMISWAAASTDFPVGITNLTGTLSVQAYLNNSTELSLNHVITLDGLTTLELSYL